MVGTEFVPQADNNELYLQFHTPVGSSLELTARQGRVQVEAALREFPGVEHDLRDDQHRHRCRASNYASVFAKLVDRTKRPMSVQQMRSRCASGCSRDRRASPSPTSAT